MHLLRPPPPPAGLECDCHIRLGSEFDEKCASLLHRSCGHRNLHFILPLEGANKHNINCRLPGQAGRHATPGRRKHDQGASNSGSFKRTENRMECCCCGWIFIMNWWCCWWEDVKNGDMYWIGQEWLTCNLSPLLLLPPLVDGWQNNSHSCSGVMEKEEDDHMHPVIGRFSRCMSLQAKGWPLFNAWRSCGGYWIGGCSGGAAVHLMSDEWRIDDDVGGGWMDRNRCKTWISSLLLVVVAFVFDEWSEKALWLSIECFGCQLGAAIGKSPSIRSREVVIIHYSAYSNIVSSSLRCN